MNSVVSADGTTIAFDRTGSGPAIIVVVGAFCDRQSKKTLSALLAERFTVFEYDRRGRGDSGQLGDDTIDHELEDFAAVAAQADESPFVFGDSSGGAIAIAAAAAGVNVRKAAVYEVPFTRGPSYAFADELAALVESGDRSEAVARFLALMGTPPEAIAGMKSGAYWPHMESFADTLPIDVRLCNDERVPDEQLSQVAVPLLAMAGGNSTWAENVANSVAAAAPRGEARILENSGHDVSDATLAAALSSFFE